MRLNADEYVLAVLSTAEGKPFTPVQLQKLFFLLDARASEDLGGPYFQFTPYDYGPFDSSVYHCATRLQGRELLDVDTSTSVRRYALTPKGQQEGKSLLAKLNPRVQDFAARCSAFVRSVPFADLVSAVYREFPEMKVNSIFREPA